MDTDQIQETRPDAQEARLPEAIPGFAQPVVRAPDPPLPVEETPEAPARRPPLLARLGLTGQRPETPADVTPTGISSRASKPSKVGIDEAQMLIAGLLGLTSLGAAWLVRRRYQHRRTLRQPTDYQLDDMALPLARIATRFVPEGLLNPTLHDAIAGLSAFGAYATAGPFVVSTIDNTPDDEDK